MSKWRPVSNCIYVIGDIHGNYKALKKILDRILPLRKNDEIIFLGDYIDRGPSSDKVLDTLIYLYNKYPEQVTCLLGNHEWLFLAALNVIKPTTSLDISPVETWLQNGGKDTILSYVSRVEIDLKTAFSMPLYRIKQIIPKTHFNFLLNNTYSYYELDNYIFVHAACNPNQPMDHQSNDILLWDRSLHEMALAHINSDWEIPWEKTVVCGHSYNGPVIHPKYMMLDTSGIKKLFCLELNSMNGFYAVAGQTRMVKGKF